MRIQKHVIDFFRANETATTSQVAEYINSRGSTRGGLSVSIQEIGGHLRKWCNKSNTGPRKISIWTLKEEFK